MPELPEVETIRKQLDEALKGRKTVHVEVLRNKSFSGNPEDLKGWKVEAVRRRAKVLEFHFENKMEIMIVHLKMTGQLIFVDSDKRIVGGHPSPDWVNELPSKHTRVIWTFSDSSRLFFNDMRAFGWMRVVPRNEYEKEKRNAVPDIVDESFTFEYFFNLLKNAKKAVKLMLLDQDRMGGLGNIYVNDALFLAGILPERPANSINIMEAKKLYESVRKVINLGIKYGGASASNYVQVTGLGGTYQDHFLVYKKEGQECSRCGGVIKKMKLSGRGTFYCPSCQK